MLGGADEMDGDTESDLLNFVEAGFGLVAEVGFIQEDDWLRAAFPDDRKVAFDAAGVQFEIERSHDKDGIDIGGDDLFVEGAAGDFAGELGLAGEDGVDAGAIFGRTCGDGNPVADGGDVCARRGGVAQLAGDVSEVFAVGGADAVEILRFFSHARGNEIWRGGEGLEFFLERGTPAQVFER